MAHRVATPESRWSRWTRPEAGGYRGAVMHRRGIVLLLGFLVAVVIAGGGGVSAPWRPAHEPQAPSAPVAPPIRYEGVAVSPVMMRAW